MRAYYLSYLQKRLLFEYVFMGLMASAYPIFTATGLELAYGLKYMAASLGPLSIVAAIACLLVFGIYIVFFLRKKERFG